ncbi:hypothetical protein [Aliivibrio sifiae]|uniref:hypothetical protein n=1 Tax=Aliivibrio sifiae TaxID=566293 RepID=UPI003D0CFC7F
MTNSTATTAPYAGANSSTNQAPPYSPQTQSSPESITSRFNTSDFMILGISMALTGVIGFFSSLIAVNSDIADNKNEISITAEKLNHIADKLNNTEGDLDKLEYVHKNLAVIDMKINHIEKSIAKK